MVIKLGLIPFAGVSPFLGYLVVDHNQKLPWIEGIIFLNGRAVDS